MTTGPVGEQAQRLFLAPVLHLAPRTIDFVVTCRRGPGGVGHQETRVAPFGRVFGFDNHPPCLVPRGRRMLDFPQLPLLFLRRLESLFRPRHQRLGRRAQPGILCQAREAMHGVLFAPAAKARVALEDDFHLRPRLPQPRDQQLQNRPRVAGGATITGSQTRHEQLFTTKNAERQETVVAVVTRQVRAFLPAMPPISRGGEVEEQPGEPELYCLALPSPFVLARRFCRCIFAA